MRVADIREHKKSVESALDDYAQSVRDAEAWYNDWRTRNGLPPLPPAAPAEEAA